MLTVDFEQVFVHKESQSALPVQVNSGKTKTISEIFSKLTIETQERSQTSIYC